MLSLQLTIEGAEVQAEVGTPDNAIALFPKFWTNDETDLLLTVSPQQFALWAAQLRQVAERCEELAEMAQPTICFPTTGMEGTNVSMA